MSINWVFIGIVLQVTAGWIFITDQLVHKFADSVVSWQRNRRNRIVTDTQIDGKPSYWRLFISGWRRSLLLTLLAFAAGLAAILIFSDETKLTFGAIIGPLFYLFLGYNLYLYSLRYVLKRMGKWDPTVHKFTGDTTDMTKANGVLFGISFILLIIVFYIIILVAQGSNLIQLVVGIPLIVSQLFILPITFMSFIYLIPETIVFVIRILRAIPPIVYWILVFSCWTAGGIILIINASGCSHIELNTKSHAPFTYLVYWTIPFASFNCIVTPHSLAVSVSHSNSFQDSGG